MCVIAVFFHRLNSHNLAPALNIYVNHNSARSSLLATWPHTFPPQTTQYNQADHERPDVVNVEIAAVGLRWEEVVSNIRLIE